MAPFKHTRNMLQNIGSHPRLSLAIATTALGLTAWGFSSASETASFHAGQHHSEALADQGLAAQAEARAEADQEAARRASELMQAYAQVGKFTLANTAAHRHEISQASAAHERHTAQSYTGMADEYQRQTDEANSAAGGDRVDAAFAAGIALLLAGATVAGGGSRRA